MRGDGVSGAAGAAGRAATGAPGSALAESVAAADAGGITAAGGGTAGRIGGTDAGGPTCLSTGDAATGRAGATGGAATVVVAGDTSVFAAGGATAGLRGATEGFSAGGCAAAAGRAGGEATSFRWVMALNTSPGREMLDKSILVLISSSLRAAREAALPAGDCPSAEERKWTRTFSASCSSRELECVFFSVTPTCVSTSRMALLLTSSSRARSLIRTLLIRPFVSPRCF
jgi:hypothetical protein